MQKLFQFESSFNHNSPFKGNHWQEQAHEQTSKENDKQLPVVTNSKNFISKRAKHDENLKKEAAQIALGYNNNSKAINYIKKKNHL